MLLSKFRMEFYQLWEHLRMSRSLYNDVMKNDEDKKTYNREFQDLRVRIYQKLSPKGLERVLFDGTNVQDHTLSIQNIGDH